MKLKKLTGLYRYGGFPLKILHFKRSKWLKFQTFNKRKYIAVYRFNKIAVSLSPFSRINRFAKFYKNKIISKRLLKYYLYPHVKKTVIKKKNREDVLFNKLFKYLYIPANILRFCKLSESVSQSKILFFKKNVSINELLAHSSHTIFLKKGDLITLKEFQKNLKGVLSKYSKKLKLYPFLQYDGYTQNILVIKNMSELTKNDISLSISEFLDIDKL